MGKAVGPSRQPRTVHALPVHPQFCLIRDSLVKEEIFENSSVHFVVVCLITSC
jgi:hypothetical protein